MAVFGTVGGLHLEGKYTNTIIYALACCKYHRPLRDHPTAAILAGLLPHFSSRCSACGGN